MAQMCAAICRSKELENAAGILSQQANSIGDVPKATKVFLAIVTKSTEFAPGIVTVCALVKLKDAAFPCQITPMFFKGWANPMTGMDSHMNTFTVHAESMYWYGTKLWLNGSHL